MGVPEPRRPARATILTAMQVADESAPESWQRARVWAALCALVWAAATLAVCFALHSSVLVAHGNEITTDRAIFAALNASTLTGFQQSVAGLREMSASGWAGPAAMLGLTLAGSLMSLVVGGMAACRILRRQRTPTEIVSAAVTSMLIATAAGAAALSGSGRNVFEAIFQAASAFGNSGLFVGPAPELHAAATYLVLLPLAVLGGLGLPVLMEATDRLFGGPSLSRHSQAVLWLTGAAYLGGVVVLVIAQLPAAWSGGWPAWQNTLASCSVAAINTRSAGLAVQSPAAFTAPGQWLLMLLMLIGAAPAGTAGGVKTTTFWHLGTGVRDLLRGRGGSRILGIAVVWLGIYLLMLFVGALLLVACEPQTPADRALFLVFSATGNVGLSHDPISDTGPGLLVLAGLMLVGRLAPLAILWWTAETTTADVAVG